MTRNLLKMTLKTIGIVLTISTAIIAQDFKSKIPPDDFGAYDDTIAWFFSAIRRNEIREEIKERNVCQTDACKILGKELRSSMNTSVDPCENFYDFVCGAWNGRIDLIPPYEDYWGRTDLFQHTVYKRIKNILEEAPEPSDILPVRQAKKWYGTCMDREERERRGIKPIESILMQTGGWPMVMDPEEWSDDDFFWQELEQNYFHITGALPFYKMKPKWKGFGGGASNLELVGIFPTLPVNEKLGRRMPTTEGQVDEWKANKSLLKRVAKVFIKHSKADVTDEMIDNDIESIVELEKKLKTLLHKDYLNTTLDEFVKQYKTNVTDIPGRNEIDFKQLFKLFSGLINVDLEDDQKIIVVSVGAFAGLSKVLSETPKRTIANYIHWYYVSKLMLYTTEELQNIWKEEIAAETGVKETPPRWLECVKESPFEEATYYAFATKYFTKPTEKAALDVIDNIRQQLALQIEDSNWLNRDGKDVLLDKLNSMKLFIGFPDWYRNETAVKATYKGFKVGYEYFENMLNLNKYELRKKLKQVEGKYEDGGPWEMQPIMVNAMYGPDKNYITLPAADFQPPLFTPGVPDNVNYGIVGAVVGHEIGHAYDDSGIMLNKQGEKTELSNQMIENYYKRAECFLDQFNNYYGVTEPIYEDTTPQYSEQSIGRRTRGENIADTTGLHSAFKAWQKVNSKRNEPENKLPGFEEFTDEQMFFIGFASSWCEIYRPEYTEKMKKEDPHSLPHLRVLGAVSNTKSFARVFKCPKGSPMNPDNKCNIWKAAEENNEISSRRRLHGRKRRSRWALSGW